MNHMDDFKAKVHVEAYKLAEEIIENGVVDIRSRLLPFLDTQLDNLLVEVDEEVGMFNDGCGCCMNETATDVLARFKGEER